MAALAIVPLIGLGGLAVDGARAYFVKSKLSQAVDAAALAGGREIFSQTLESDIEKYFTVNYGNGFLNSTVDGPYHSVSAGNELLEVWASASVPTTFMRVLGQDSVTVSARAVTRRAVRGMELALVMDNTGSMRGGGKMDAMKSAAAELIQILYGNNETIQNFWVSLIPYTATVNIGGHRTTWVDPYNPADFDPTIWKGCVEARPGGLDVTDDPPSVATWPVFFYPSASDNNWPPVNEANSAQNNGTGPNLGCGPAITSLIASKSDILDSIDEMQPWHRGGTMTNLGLGWGWRTISPRWRNLWGGDTPANLPLDYDEPLMDKVVVILTDGENQFYDNPPSGPSKSDYTAYGRLGWGRVGTTNSGAARNEINDRLIEICDAMKDEDIILYTITFRLNGSSVQDMWRSCATSPAHYFNSPNNNELQQVFRQIGTRLSNLRLAE